MSPWWLVVLLVLATFAVSAWAYVTSARLRDTRAELARAYAELDRLAKERWPGRTRWMARTAAKAVAGTAGRLRDGGVGGLLASSLDDLARWVRDDRTEIEKLVGRDGTATVFFSDIEGSTALNEELGDRRWVRVLREHDSLVRAGIERHHGHVVKNQGDGYMVVFPAATAAVDAAVWLQRRLAERRRSSTAVTVRIGLHTGPVVSHDGDYFGRNVALAARVAACAAGGEILVTDDVRDTVLAAPHATIDFTESVTTELKGLAGTYRLWSAAWD